MRLMLKRGVLCVTKDFETEHLPELGETLSREHGRTVRHSLQLDVAYYQDLFDDPELSDAEKEQVITALWSIIVAFVELGFGVHPAQQACGQDGTNQDQSSNFNTDSVNWESLENIDNRKDAPEP